MKSNNNAIGAGIAEAGAGLSTGLRKFFSETNKTTKGELSEAGKDARAQIFGLESELKEGEELALSEEKSEETEEKANSAEHQAYVREIIQSSERYERKENQELREQVEGLREELKIEAKKMDDASQEMSQTVKELATQEAPAEVGKYHLNFYEWIFFTIRNAREKMEEVNTVVAIFQSRKKEKQFSALSKSQGTKYSMSSEHSIVRQNG